MFGKAKGIFKARIEEIAQAGTKKVERVITTPQGANINTDTQNDILNMCANNYLGLANDKRVVEAAEKNIKKYGYGMSSVRFICGTQDIHKELEAKLSGFLHTEDTILYSSCFDANGGLFEALLGKDDAVISDALNHASIIDGIRLCKAQRYRYASNDMSDLEAKLKEAQGARIRLIMTDGVFSMEGVIANLKGICDLADKYDALVAVDDSHATGFIGKTGAGTPELCGVQDRVDILTGTLGKALGGASGGYTSGRKEIIDLLRQVSRPYLFSNTLAPVIASTTCTIIDIIKGADKERAQLASNMQYFAEKMTELGFDVPHTEHPIIPVMLYDAKVAGSVAAKLYEHGVYATAFTYPVVPQGKARIRTQMSAAHTQKDLDKAIGAFEAARKELGLK